MHWSLASWLQGVGLPEAVCVQVQPLAEVQSLADVSALHALGVPVHCSKIVPSHWQPAEVQA